MHYIRLSRYAFFHIIIATFRKKSKKKKGHFFVMQRYTFILTKSQKTEWLFHNHNLLLNKPLFC